MKGTCITFSGIAVLCLQYISDELLPDMNLDSQLTSTPMTSHSHTREEKPHDDHVTLQLYDKPLNRTVHVGMFNIQHDVGCWGSGKIIYWLSVSDVRMAAEINKIILHRDTFFLQIYCFSVYLGRIYLCYQFLMVLHLTLYHMFFSKDIQIHMKHQKDMLKFNMDIYQ